jgi:hypothetical protein
MSFFKNNMNKRPRSEDPETGNTQGNQADVARKGLVSLNRLDYVLQPDLSVVTSRTVKRHFFQQNAYQNGNRAIAILNSGAEYIDPQNSYLQFNVQIRTPRTGASGNSVYFLGVGSALNFIKRAILTSRSGDELERCDEVGQLACVLDRYMHGNNWLETHGKMMGYESGYPGIITANENKGTEMTVPLTSTAPNVSPIYQYIIPLSCLFGMFRSFDRLLPSMLMSGLRIELEFESGLRSMISDDTKAYAYEIQSPEIVLDSYTLTDSIQRVLNEESAIRGLELVYTSFYYHSAQPKTMADTKQAVNIEVRKAVSRALGVLTKIRPQDKVDSSPLIDYYRSKPFATSSYQLRLGSLYFPHQPIVDKGAIDSCLKEMYWHTMHGFGKIKTPSAPSCVTPYDGQQQLVNQNDKKAVDITTYPSYKLGMQAIYTDLERSTTQRLTGIPVNNSRVAEVQMTDVFWVSPTSSGEQYTGWTVDVWLHYVRLARVFLQNVEIEE